MKKFSHISLSLILIFFAGFLGVWVGQLIFGTSHDMMRSSQEDIHTLLHNDLNINAAQEEQLSVIEKDFRRLKILHEGQMKTANLELAQAIKAGGYKSPAIEPIVHKIHSAMSALQALSLDHLAQMELVLGEEQNQKLKERVIDQLYRNAGQ